MYTPPFTISAETINKIAEISGQIERYAIRLEQTDALHLRKANRIRTIHSSLAIEGNKLTEDAENGGYPPTQNGDIRSLFWLFSLMALQN